MLQSVTSNEVADSLRENHVFSDSSHSYSTQNVRSEQIKIEQSQRSVAESELERELDKLNEIFNENVDELKTSVITEDSKEVYLQLSLEDRIKNETNTLREEGNSSKEILKSLLAEFGEEESVSLWVDNWKNFLRLHEIAESKSPKEKSVIQNIIGKSDFSNEGSFKTALATISKNGDISQSTKREIFKEFKGFEISSVSDLDRELKKVKNQQKEIGKLISENFVKKDRLEKEIDIINQKLKSNNLSLPERQELEAKIQRKSKILANTEDSIIELKENQTKEVSLELREGFIAILNPDGSRSIKLLPSEFIITLPNNDLPFMGKKNIRSINLSFVFMTLSSLGMSSTLFNPPLLNGGTPSKAHRNTGHLILKELGFNDSKIITNSEILQLDEDLKRLKIIAPNESGTTCLRLLGVYDQDDQNVNKDRFKVVLELIKTNRRMSDDLFIGKLKYQIANNLL